MKTVPRNVRVVTQKQAAQLADLPEEMSLALADIAAVAREGLLAMSVAAGMAVMATMFEAELTAAAGVKGKHNPERTAVRHGTEKGSVTLGGCRVQVTRPRARTLDGHEVPLQAYSQFTADDLLSQVVLERMLAGVATRRHARIGEPIGKAVLEAASSTGRSAVSRRFVKETETALADLLARDLTQEKIKVLMLDGEHMAGRCVIVALGITADGRKLPIGLWDGATEKGRGPIDAGRPGLARAVGQGRAAGRDGRREGLVGGRERGLRRPRGGAALHRSQAQERRRSPAGQGEGVGRREAREGVQPPRP
jgi:putative transposase